MMTEKESQPVDLAKETKPTVSKRRVMWLFNCIGTETSLLYWNGLFPPYLKQFPNSEIFCARPPSKPIPGTDYQVECVGSWRIPLGKRSNSYERQFVIASPSIISRIRKAKPDVVVVSELLAFAIYIAIFRRFISKSKILVMLEGNPYQGKTRRPHWLILALRRFACRHVDYFMTNNDGGREYLSDLLGVPAGKIMVRPFLVSEIEPLGDRKVDLPELIANDGDQVAFLYVGQLVERKGVIQLVRAFSQLSEEMRSETRLWLVGDGEQRTEIEELVRENGLEQSVRVLGRQPYEDLPAFYAAADVFVMPTLDDYRALVGFEALSQELPMLHSIYDGARHEVVSSGENGFTFDPLDIEQTAQRLEWFVVNRHRLEEMSRVSARLSRRFTIEEAVNGMAEAIENCHQINTAKN